MTFSPLHNIKKNNALPTLFMVGDNDKLVPLKTAQKFKDLTEENGATCILKVYKNKSMAFLIINQIVIINTIKSH